jgi:hypothetical protein
VNQISWSLKKDHVSVGIPAKKAKSDEDKWNKQQYDSNKQAYKKTVQCSFSHQNNVSQINRHIHISKNIHSFNIPGYCAVQYINML